MKTPKRGTQAHAFWLVAKTLRESGYPDVTAEMVSDVWKAMTDGKPETEMPHGIVGRFAFSQLDEVRDQLNNMPAGAP